MTSNIWNMIETYYITSPAWLVLSILSLVYIFYVASKDSRKKIAGCVVLSVIVLLNDFSYSILTKLFDSASYYRFLWCFPYVMIVAMAMLLCLRRLKGRKEPVVALVFILAITGVMVFTQGNMVSRLRINMPQNKYEVERDIIELREILVQDKQCDTGEEKGKVIACPEAIMLQYQTIDAESIVVTSRNIYLNIRNYGMDLKQCDQATQDAYLLSTVCQDNAKPEQQEVWDAMQRLQVNYMVVHIDADMEGYLESLGCKKIGQTTSYLVYRYDACNKFAKANSLQDVNVIKETIGLNEDIVDLDLQLAKPHKIIAVNDMHIISMDGSVESEYKDTVCSRRDSLFLNNGIPSTVTWDGISSILDSYEADGIVFIGDMIDYNAQTNIAILQQGLDKIQTPYIYLRADHDLGVWYTNEKRTNQDAIDATSKVALWQEVFVVDYSDFYLVGWNNSTSQLSETALNEMQMIFQKAKMEKKPIILATHVPINSAIDDGLKQAAQNVDPQGRAKLWGKGCLYEPNETTEKFLNMVLAADSPVKVVLAGHLHFKYTTKLNENITEYVLDKSYSGNIGIINVR